MSEDTWNRRDKWARLRFSIIGGLLASPPGRGELRPAIEALAARRYQHPTRPHEWITVGVSTIERWYYAARNARDPVESLRRKVRSDAGGGRVMSLELLQELRRQYRAHPGWSYDLHLANLTALVEERPQLGPPPSYSTLRRQMKARGWIRKRSRRRKTAGQRAALERLEKREVRSFEHPYTHGLWHADFHSGRCRVLDSRGWHTPRALAFLDDHSRLCCHIQWYLHESAEAFIHGLSQAFLKRGLPRGLMTDNGAAMRALETGSGLFRLGIQHELTLPYSPHQNGKIESFWGQLEGRLLAMVRQIDPLTLGFLNQATQAWIELEYNRRRHEELDCSPVERAVHDPGVARPAPSVDQLRLAFTVQERRMQRRSDGTITIGGVRFELPGRFRHFEQVHVRYQSWDLSVAWLVDQRSGDVLARLLPQDAEQNADGQRRCLEPLDDLHKETPRDEHADPIPPHLRKLLREQAATGLPPAYLPLDEEAEGEDDED